MDSSENISNVTPNALQTAEPTSATKISPEATNIVAALFVAVQIPVALGGNFIVIASFYTFRDLRTKCNFFIISLAISDLLVAFIAMPFWLTLQITQNVWIYGDMLKQFWDCMDILCGTASIMNLTAVSFDRQLAITSPFLYPKVLTTRRVICLICFVWCYAATISCLVLISSNEHQWPYPNYLWFVSVLSFFLPLAIMLVMYARIYLVARYQARQIGRNYATDIKAAKTIAVVIGGFVICWLPFFTVVLSYANRTNIPISFLNVAKWLEYLNSCLNPVIYTCLNRTYRSAFKKLLRRCRLKIKKDQREQSKSNTMLTVSPIVSMDETQAPLTVVRRECFSNQNEAKRISVGTSDDVVENFPLKETGPTQVWQSE
ncbi:tyramine receptor 1-like isoform X2 [Stylophora pistillata]|nr:tyramine receptor 1-like isoform X2 [Stylophora pistillata]